MKIILISFTIIQFVQSTSQIINLRLTRDGLLCEGLILPPPFPRIRSAYIFDTTNSYPSNFVMSTNYSNEGIRYMHLGPNSTLASMTTSVMILPPNESHPTFRLVRRPSDPRSFCDERGMSIAEMPTETAIQIAASVSLVRNIESGDYSTMIGTATDSSSFVISTISMFDVIPAGVYDTLLAEIRRLGVQTADDENINLLPAIEYTIFRSRESDEVVARIVSFPQDYLEFNPEGMRLMVRPDSEWTRPQLGINTLKHTGILLDYQRHQIGFFEPL